MNIDFEFSVPPNTPVTRPLILNHPILGGLATRYEIHFDTGQNHNLYVCVHLDGIRVIPPANSSTDWLTGDNQLYMGYINKKVNSHYLTVKAYNSDPTNSRLVLLHIEIQE